MKTNERKLTRLAAWLAVASLAIPIFNANSAERAREAGAEPPLTEVQPLKRESQRRRKNQGSGSGTANRSAPANNAMWIAVRPPITPT